MRRGIKGLLLGITIGLVGSLFGLSPYGISFERSVGLEWLFTTRSAVERPPEAVVIAIDGFTGAKLGHSRVTSRMATIDTWQAC